MKTSSDIKRDVENELRWSPDIHEKDIAIKVADGVVTLSGFVPSAYEKYLAESAVKRVAGVAGVANDLTVRLPYGAVTDPEIAREAVAAVDRVLPMVSSGIQVIVEQGKVTLEGSVEWNYQREDAEAAVRRVKGVTSVRDAITVKPRVNATEVKEKIQDAFRRSAVIDAQHITVEALGSEVTLRGQVHSWAERQEAQNSAWSAPGVFSVRNELTVRP